LSLRFFKEGFHIDNLGMAAAALLLFGYPAAQIVYITLTLRYGIKIIDKSIVLKDFLFWRERNITGKIRGYSSSFAGNYHDIKCIIIYLEDGRHINLPRYMYLNYMDIEPALKQYGLTFLGTEPYTCKYIVARGYAYDNPGNFKQNA